MGSPHEAKNVRSEGTRLPALASPHTVVSVPRRPPAETGVWAAAAGLLSGAPGHGGPRVWVQPLGEEAAEMDFFCGQNTGHGKGPSVAWTTSLRGWWEGRSPRFTDKTPFEGPAQKDQPAPAGTRERPLGAGPTHDVPTRTTRVSAGRREGPLPGGAGLVEKCREATWNPRRERSSDVKGRVFPFL